MWRRLLIAWVCIVAMLLAATAASAASSAQVKPHQGTSEFFAALNVYSNPLATVEAHTGNALVATTGTSDVPDAARGIATPYGVALQEATPAAEAALAEARAGATVFRQGAFGVQETAGAQFWAPTNPAAAAEYAARFGLPGGAAPNWIMGGTLRAGAPAITRAAPGIGTNAGGAIEVVTQPGGVTGLWFHMP